jgi:hypothetical protein
MITNPGKTSSGSCICGFFSTIKGSPHLSLMLCRVSPSPTTYISSHRRCPTRLLPLITTLLAVASTSASDMRSLPSRRELMRISTNSAKVHDHDAASAIDSAVLRIFLSRPPAIMRRVMRAERECFEGQG